MPGTPSPTPMVLDAVTEADGMMPLPPSPSHHASESLHAGYGFKYCPCQLGESEDLESYKPGGFHPVHLGDTYDNRYTVVHKLGSGGFSTVWLARDADEQQWVALKIIMAHDSATYESRSIATNDKHVHLLDRRLFAIPLRNFWIDGPNGRHLCLVLPVLGPNLSSLSTGIYSRLQPAFVKHVSLQAGQALVALHANGICHGDFTARNIALRLVDDINRYDEEDILRLFGEPKRSSVMLYSGKPPRPHAPDYNVVPLDFCSSAANLLTGRVCIIDFDQSFTTSSPPDHLGIPAKYLAPEVAVGLSASPASDVWALGCLVFRIRSGEDLFFDYDTDSPGAVLQQIAKTIDGLPEEWKSTRFDEEGCAVLEDGEPIYFLEETTSLAERIQGIFDEPCTRSINLEGDAVGAVDVAPAVFEEWAEMRVPYPEVFEGMVWKSTAVCIDGRFVVGYEEIEVMAKAFPRISAEEEPVLLDLLSKIFVYDPAHRIRAEDLSMGDVSSPDELATRIEAFGADFTQFRSKKKRLWACLKTFATPLSAVAKIAITPHLDARPWCCVQFRAGGHRFPDQVFEELHPFSERRGQYVANSPDQALRQKIVAILSVFLKVAFRGKDKVTKSLMDDLAKLLGGEQKYVQAVTYAKTQRIDNTVKETGGKVDAIDQTGKETNETAKEVHQTADATSQTVKKIDQTGKATNDTVKGDASDCRCDEPDSQED
ncbi:kinase-like domain-containing protein [Podospora appendiculata]|uniref:non-specific serine/threonine protein kinase n=1 Tax=Podospora appendiculata TaxID=314037 RepID=A0AAE0X3T8_9PEZI|nr:kinase-like domain-containing protein [Podospora appendiculata]